MKILVIGSGGREHVLACKFSASSNVTTVYVAPGNAGTALDGGMINVPIEVDDINGLLDFAKTNEIDLTVVGPELPLVLGISDAFAKANLPCFGPSADAAQLEGSKNFAKEFMQRHNIPTASYQSFTAIPEAIKHLEQCDFPIVIKADGLAAGKGVVIAQNLVEATSTVSDMLEDNKFGEAGSRVVIEEFLQGEEASFICIVSGTDVLPMASSQDHKAAYEGDKGPNTGGMGAYSPSPLVDEEVFDRIMNTIIRPTVNGLISEGIHYIGFLYAGLMIDENKMPKVVEYNCRFGDPEAQPVLRRLNSDLTNLCSAAVHGNLANQQADWDPRPCLGVVMAAEGYPDSYRKGEVIKGLELSGNENTEVFHAGTKLVNNEVVTNGGRVLCVTAIADTVSEAQQVAYARMQEIHWPGSWYRRDIGHHAISKGF